MAFATTDDIATRLMRTLTDEELAAAELLLDGVTAELEDAVTRSEADISEGEDVLRSISIEAVVRELASPTGAESTSETIGSYSYDVRYGSSSQGGSLLTELDGRRARKAVWGTNSGSVMLGSIFQEVED